MGYVWYIEYNIVMGVFMRKQNKVPDYSSTHYKTHIHSMLESVGFRICKKKDCWAMGIPQPLENFKKNPQQYLGRHLYCNRCMSITRRKYYYRKGK